MATDFEERLREVETRYEQVSTQMSSPEVSHDPDQLRTLGMAFAELEEIVQPYRELVA